MHMLTLIADRASSTKEWDALSELLLEYASTDLAQPQLSSIWQDLKDVRARYAAPEGGAILLYIDQVLAGCVAFTQTRLAQTCEFKRLFIRKRFRQQGWGIALLKEARVRAREAGYARGVLSTWPDNQKALAMYASLGFVPVASFKEQPGQELVFLGCDL